MKAVRLMIAGGLVLAAALTPTARAVHASPIGADVSVTMNDGLNGAAVAVNSTITYTITVTNNEPSGGTSAANVVVNDVLIDYVLVRVQGLVPFLGTTITGISSTYAGSSCSIPADPAPPPGIDYWQIRKTASCSLGTLPAATTATVTVTAKVQRTNTEGVHHGTPVVNTARVSSDTPDPQPANNVAVTQTPVVPFP